MWGPARTCIQDVMSSPGRYVSEGHLHISTGVQLARLGHKPCGAPSAVSPELAKAMPQSSWRMHLLTLPALQGDPDECLSEKARTQKHLVKLHNAQGGRRWIDVTATRTSQVASDVLYMHGS
jgi:hypothetical protein